MADFIVRPATPDDAAALGELGALLVRLHHEFDPERFMRPQPGIEEGYGRFLASQINRDEAMVFVAERDGEVGGYVYAALEERSWRECKRVSSVSESPAGSAAPLFRVTRRTAAWRWPATDGPVSAWPCPRLPAAPR